MSVSNAKSSELSEKYRQFIATTAGKVASFKRLHSFLQSGCINHEDISKPKGVTKITYMWFGEHELPGNPTEINEDSLQDTLAEDKECKLYIIENISPSVIACLGGSWDVDPQFFLDYLDDLPWWRIEDVESHLKPLPSVLQAQSDHFVLKFLASREFQSLDGNEKPIAIPERIEALELSSGRKQIGGGLNPIPRNGRKFHPIGLIRRTAVVWFSPCLTPTNMWKKGSIATFQ
jgi:hypothetical protein